MGAGWSSGISVYGVLATLGLAGRAGWVDAPTFLERWWVIAAAVGLFCVEFVVDKIALLDSVWDGVHTVVRPAIGGLLMTTVGDTSWSAPALAASGVVLALSSHSAKSSTRLVVNSSPEPASNVVVSLAEDGLAATVMTLAIARPELAVTVVALLTVLSLVAAFVLYRLARRIGRTVRGGIRAARRTSADGPIEP